MSQGFSTDPTSPHRFSNWPPAPDDPSQYAYVPLDGVMAEGDPALWEKFRRFHHDNPHIFSTFVRFTREWIDVGARQGSGWMVINRVRWMSAMTTDTHEPWRISNDYIACYTRLAIYYFPDLDNFFVTKEMKAYRPSSHAEYEGLGE